MEIRDCANALLPTPDPGKLVNGCFSAAELIAALGWKGVLLAPIMVLGSVVEFFHSEVSSFVDILTGTDQYTVVITRLDLQGMYDSYVGDWHVHGYGLSIKAGQTGSSTMAIGPCTLDPQDMSICTESATISFAINNDGSIIGTIQTIQYTSDSSPYPGTPVGAAEHVGDHFTLVHEPQSYLLYQTWTNGNPSEGVSNNGNYLCADSYSGYECGA